MVWRVRACCVLVCGVALVNGRVREHTNGCVCGGCVKVPSAVGVASIGARTHMSTSAKEDVYEVSAAVRAKRPTSPHLTIYKLPVGAISSITNRVTGCILAGGEWPAPHRTAHRAPPVAAQRNRMRADADMRMHSTRAARAAAERGSD